MGNKGISDKARLLLEYSENLFLNYEGKLNYQTSETLMKEFWDKILEFAKSKGCDMDLFYLDGLIQRMIIKSIRKVLGVNTQVIGFSTLIGCNI